jgi:hypothetical protein
MSQYRVPLAIAQFEYAIELSHNQGRHRNFSEDASFSTFKRAEGYTAGIKIDRTWH